MCGTTPSRQGTRCCSGRRPPSTTACMLWRCTRLQGSTTRSPRSYAQAVSQQDRSTHQKDPDMGAGVIQGTVQQEAISEGQQEEGEGGQDQREVGQAPEQGGQESIRTGWASG